MLGGRVARLLRLIDGKGRDCSALPNTTAGTNRIIDSVGRAYLLLRQEADPAPSKPTEQTMRISSILRAATLALTLVAAMGAMGSTAFAASRVQQPQAANSNSGIYDSPNFVVAPTDIHS
ncbi:MAG TPA: hypothetical protein VGP48_14725 [Stellaceae bacterium]|jgi:hypothetical protein|nr:hypothetical protein [Stellaceae bacterium]